MDRSLQVHFDDLTDEYFVELPDELVDELGWEIGDEIEWEVVEGAAIMNITFVLNLPRRVLHFLGQMQEYL